MKALISNLIIWIKKPDDIVLEINLKDKLILFVKLFFLDILIGVMFMILLYWIHFYIVKLDDPLLDDSPFMIFLLAVVIAPLIEELVFRLPLKYERNYFAQILDTYFNDWIKDRWGCIFKYFLYFMVLAFGLIHLSNFNNNESIFYILGPIIVGSQLVGGLLISYVRIKLGFLWGVLQHSLFNFVGVVFVMLFFHNQDVIDLSTPRYNLQVIELMYIHKEDSNYSSDFENNIIYSIEAENVSLQRVINNWSVEQEQLYDDMWVDFHFECKEGIDSKELIEILKEKIKFEE